MKQRVEAKLAQAGRDLAADGRIDGDVGAQGTPAPQGPTAKAAPPATGGAPDAQPAATRIRQAVEQNRLSGRPSTGSPHVAHSFHATDGTKRSVT